MAFNKQFFQSNIKRWVHVFSYVTPVGIEHTYQTLDYLFGLCYVISVLSPTRCIGSRMAWEPLTSCHMTVRRWSPGTGTETLPLLTGGLQGKVTSFWFALCTRTGHCVISQKLIANALLMLVCLVLLRTSHESLHSLDTKTVRCVHVHPVQKQYIMVAENRYKMGISAMMCNMSANQVDPCHYGKQSLYNPWDNPMV